MGPSFNLFQVRALSRGLGIPLKVQMLIGSPRVFKDPFIALSKSSQDPLEEHKLSLTIREILGADVHRLAEIMAAILGMLAITH